MLDTLVVIGLATASLGTINEADGIRQRTFVVRNDGRQAVALNQGYTSCGCTKIFFPKDKVLQPRDTAHVTLSFNPRNKGGEFYESGTIEYGQRRKRITMAMQGECITSEETLMRQFPVVVNERLRLSADHFDLGRLRRGETRERRVIVLHRNDNNRREPVTIRYTADAGKSGLQHVTYPLKVRDGKKVITTNIKLDVFITP